jgi:hypothetical protein
VNYNQIEGKVFKPLAIMNAQEASQLWSGKNNWKNNERLITAKTVMKRINSKIYERDN